MLNDVVTFAIDASVAPELAVAASGLAEGLAAIGRECEVLVDPWPEALAGRSRVIEVGDADHAPGRWRLDLGPRSELELVDPSERASAIPFALPCLGASAGGRGCVLFIGGEAGRRTRMMSRTFDALRRRSGNPVVVWRALPDEVLRQRFPGDVHSDMRGEELARLLAMVAALVEVSDEATTEGMLIAAVGRASGIPTVIHEAFPAERWDGRVLVSEWSGEAFADAAIAAAKLPRNDDVAAEARRIAAERLAGALS